MPVIWAENGRHSFQYGFGIFLCCAKHVPSTTSDSTKTIRPASFYGLTATAATSDARSGPQVLDVPYMPRWNSIASLKRARWPTVRPYRCIHKGLSHTLSYTDLCNYLRYCLRRHGQVCIVDFLQNRRGVFGAKKRTGFLFWVKKNANVCSQTVC